MVSFEKKSTDYNNGKTVSQNELRKCVSSPASFYTVIHLLVVDVACVLFWTQSVCMVPNQNTQNIYHKQMNNGVDGSHG